MIARNLLLELPFQAIRGLWNEYLVCPKLALFSFEDAETWFRNVIGEIFAMSEPQLAHAGMPGPILGRAALSYFPSGARSDIMESARLHRLLRFVYDGLERIVDPYALVFKRRRDGVGREYFYGWDRVGGRSGEIGIKSYIADKVHSVSILDETFEPRFPIELTKSVGYLGASFSSSRPSAFSASRAKRAQTSYRNEYTVECPYCNKRFKRSS